MISPHIDGLCALSAVIVNIECPGFSPSLQIRSALKNISIVTTLAHVDRHVLGMTNVICSWDARAVFVWSSLLPPSGVWFEKRLRLPLLAALTVSL